MSSPSGPTSCEQTDLVTLHALGALPADDARELETHLSSCPECRQELAALQSVVESFVSWPTDVLRPSESLWRRVEQRVAGDARPAAAWHGTSADCVQPDWEEIAPGISCKLLASDTDRDRVSMLVRLAPRSAYPPHIHAGIEELHLLDGELWIDDRKLYPGDYSRAEAGTGDQRVWSETGCTCVLITSASDQLR